MKKSDQELYSECEIDLEEAAKILPSKGIVKLGLEIVARNRKRQLERRVKRVREEGLIRLDSRFLC